MAYRKIPFQRLRIFWAGIKYAGMAGAAKEDNPALSEAYQYLSELHQQALTAINSGPRAANEFVAKLDRMIEMNGDKGVQSELDAMLKRAREQTDYQQ